MVPKGRFELPRPYGHYALNVARLPVPPLRHVALTSAPEYTKRSRTPQAAVRAVKRPREVVMSMLRALRRRHPPLDIELLTGPGCPLCDEAESAARAAFRDAALRVVDIAGRRDLEDEFIFRIPVLRFADTVVCEGRITVEDARLAEHLAARIAEAQWPRKQ